MKSKTGEGLGSGLGSALWRHWLQTLYIRGSQPFDRWSQNSILPRPTQTFSLFITLRRQYFLQVFFFAGSLCSSDLMLLTTYFVFFHLTTTAPWWGSALPTIQQSNPAKCFGISAAELQISYRLLHLFECNSLWVFFYLNHWIPLINPSWFFLYIKKKSYIERPPTADLQYLGGPPEGRGPQVGNHCLTWHQGSKWPVGNLATDT